MKQFSEWGYNNFRFEVGGIDNFKSQDQKIIQLFVDKSSEKLAIWNFHFDDDIKYLIFKGNFLFFLPFLNFSTTFRLGFSHILPKSTYGNLNI